MRTLSPILAAVLLAALPGGATIGFAQAQTCTCPPTGGEAASGGGSYDGGGSYGPRIIADEAPPPLPEYEQPPLPAPGYIWTPGYWNWNNDDYYWVPGTWVEPPHPGLLWTPGYWGFVNGAYMFNRGYWGPRVGFYGGVSYGYGYTGNGFEGGRWDGNRFFYNRTVNNFGSVHIINVYERPVPRIVERASFNGGPNGVRARPTPEQIALQREKHIPPTVAQRRNVRAASRNEAAFVTNNKGKPPIAATQKPGEFKGPAVVPAKAAGGPVKLRPLDEARPGAAEGQKVMPEAGKPQVGQPEVGKPEVGKPQAGQPEVGKPELKGGAPEAQKPGARPGTPEARPTNSETRPAAKPGAGPAGKPEAQPQAKPEARPQAKPEVRPQARPEVRPQARPELRPQARPELRPQAKPEPRPQARPEARPQARPEARPQARPEARPQGRPEARPAPRSAAPRPQPRRDGEPHPG